jgi:hypothetical protein
MFDLAGTPDQRTPWACYCMTVHVAAVMRFDLIGFTGSALPVCVSLE